MGLFVFGGFGIVVGWFYGADGCGLAYLVFGLFRLELAVALILWNCCCGYFCCCFLC